MKIVMSLIIFVSFFVSCTQSQEGLDKNWIKSVNKKNFIAKDGKISFTFDDKATGTYKILKFDDDASSLGKDWANDIMKNMKFEFVSSPERNKAIYKFNFLGESYVGFIMKGKEIYTVSSKDKDTVESPDDLDWETLEQSDSSIYVKQ